MGVELTPYEKNLDFWRQLWRVVERSDVIVQIVDARDPMLYRCRDFEKKKLGHPLPRIDLVGSIEATEDLQFEYVPTDDDGIHGHNLNEPISDILKLYDPTEAVVLSGLPESLSSPTDEERIDNSGSSIE